MKTIIRSTITGGVFTALLISLGACAKDQNDSEFSGYANVINVAADGTTQFLSQKDRKSVVLGNSVDVGGRRII